MKANEAAKLADAAAAKLKKEREIKEENDRKAEIAEEKKRRLRFREDIRERFKSAIAYSVKTGRRNAQVTIVESANTPVRANAILDEHGYKDIIQDVVKEVEADGYTVGTIVKTYEYRTSHESSVPDYNYYEYQKLFEVKW